MELSGAPTGPGGSLGVTLGLSVLFDFHHSLIISFLKNILCVATLLQNRSENEFLLICLPAPLAVSQSISFQLFPGFIFLYFTLDILILAQLNGSPITLSPTSTSFQLFDLSLCHPLCDPPPLVYYSPAHSDAKSHVLNLVLSSISCLKHAHAI